MNKEEVLINEIIQVLNNKKIKKNTKYLKNLNLKKIDDIIAKGEQLSKNKNSISTYILEKLEKDFNKINNNYEDFISSNFSKQSLDEKKRFIKENKKLSKQDIPLYKSLSSLYDSKETKWLKSIVNLNLLLEKMNKDKNDLRCPICQYNSGDIFDKDHFLPRSVFPTLTISRKNLIPTCRACNTRLKRDKIANLPIFNIKNIDSSFLDNYVDILLKINSSTNFNIEIIPKKTLKDQEKIKVQNILDLYNLKARYNNESVINYCDKYVGKILDNTEEKIKSLDNKNIKNIRRIINGEWGGYISEIEDGEHHYKKLLKIYINAYFKEYIDVHIYEYTEEFIF